jgi:phospholipid/cholesterol/gamma-HCH transport system substrate-binding protein
VDHRIPKAGLIVSLVCAGFAALSFLFLNEAFEGPSVTSTLTGDGYTLTAEFEDTEILPTKQPVLLRGLAVGKVKGVEFNKDESTATVEFSVDDEYAPVYEDATVAVGERTVLGDPYLKLIPGTEAAGEVSDGGEIRAVDSVDFDEALDFLDEEGRAHVKSTLGELSKATRSDTGAQELNETVGGLTRTVAQLRLLTDALVGQEDDLAGLVSDSATVLDELGAREDAIRSIVASGRTTLDALAANAESLDAGLAEAPGVLASAREALAEARPLLAQTAPLIAQLRKAAPKLSGVLADLPQIMAETVGVTGRLSGVPTMRELLKVIRLIAPAVPGIEASARNMQPLLAYTGARAKAIGNFFANLRGATGSADADGHWIRTAAVLDPFLGVDVNGEDGCPEFGLCYNGYPSPGDSLDPQPYEPGSYPRLYPFDPPEP